MKSLIEAKEAGIKDSDVYYYLGLSYMGVKDYFNALENFNTHINISKEYSINTLCSLSICYYKLKDYNNYYYTIKQIRKMQKLKTSDNSLKCI